MAERETTTIEVSMETWRQLTKLKDEPGKSFDTVIQELLSQHRRDTRDTEMEAATTESVSQEPEEDSGDLLGDVDFPGRGEHQRKARADAIRHAYELIHTHEKIETAEMMDLVWESCDRDEIGYSASDAGRGEWWQLYDGTVRKALKQLDGVRPPAPQSTPSVWRWVGSDE